MPGFIQNKIVKRLVSGAMNGFRTFVGLLGNAVIAWWVLRETSESIWGGFVNDLIFVSLAVHFLSWGNKEFLLRSISREPAALGMHFYRIFWARFCLLAIPLILVFFLFPSELWWGIGLWLIAQFAYQSLQVLIVYRKTFVWAGIVELLGLSLALSALVYYGNIDRSLLVWIFAISTFFRVLLLGIKLWPGRVVWRADFGFFALGLPFFLIGFSGLLQSKTDLYVVNFLMDDSAVGVYQVVISIFLFYQAVGGLVLEPLAKNLYRSGAEVFSRLQRLMTLFGLGLILITAPLLWWIFTEVYHFRLSWDYYLYGYLFAFPAFVYLPWIYKMYKVGRENQVMWLNFAGAGVNLLATLIFLYYLGLPGAILGSALAQWFMCSIYWYWNKSKKVNEV